MQEPKPDKPAPAKLPNGDNEISEADEMKARNSLQSFFMNEIYFICIFHEKNTHTGNVCTRVMPKQGRRDDRRHGQGKCISSFFYFGLLSLSSKILAGKIGSQNSLYEGILQQGWFSSLSLFPPSPCSSLRPSLRVSLYLSLSLSPNVIYTYTHIFIRD